VIKLTESMRNLFLDIPKTIEIPRLKSGFGRFEFLC
jgi:hypothetical protein